MKITEHKWECLKWKDNSTMQTPGQLKCEKYTEIWTGYNQYSSGQINNIYKMKESVNTYIYNVLSTFTFLIILIFLPFIMLKIQKKGWRILKK